MYLSDENYISFEFKTVDFMRLWLLSWDTVWFIVNTEEEFSLKILMLMRAAVSHNSVGCIT
jgi:hypothetical protein